MFSSIIDSIAGIFKKSHGDTHIHKSVSPMSVHISKDGSVVTIEHTKKIVAETTAAHKRDLPAVNIHSTVEKIHPNHYKTQNGKQVIDFIEKYCIDFRLGNAVKYLMRAGKKQNETFYDDINKAIWHINRYREIMIPIKIIDQGPDLTFRFEDHNQPTTLDIKSDLEIYDLKFLMIKEAIFMLATIDSIGGYEYRNTQLHKATDLLENQKYAATA